MNTPNKSVPLESFEKPFDPSGLSNAIATKQVVVSTLRFIEKKLVPAIDRFEGKMSVASSSPRDLWATGQSIEQFIKDMKRSLARYSISAFSGLSEKDGSYAQSFTQDYLKDKLKGLAQLHEGTQSASGTELRDQVGSFEDAMIAVLDGNLE